MTGLRLRCVVRLLAPLVATLLAVRAQAAVSLAEAHALLDSWQLEDAKAAAERFMKEDPDDPEVLLLAARVQLDRGEHLAALSLFDAAGAATSARGFDYLRDLAASSAAYQAEFQTLESPHFSIRYLNKDEIVAAYAVPVLEAAYANIGGDLGLLPAERGEKIVVEIYPDARGLAGATGLTIREIETSGTIAVCKFHRLMITSPLATAGGYSWADTIAHEFTHLIISKKSKNTVPIWLHEGIAKYYETRWRGAAGLALSPYAEKLLARAVKKGKLITYQQMHPSMAKLPSQEDAALAFAEVFTTIEYVVKQYGKTSIPKLLTVLGRGTDLDAALSKVFGKNLTALEAAWRKYLKRRPFHEEPGAEPHPIRLATSEAADKPKPLETMKDREVHDFARLGELLQLRGHTQAAIVEYEKAYAKAGTEYPSLSYRLASVYAEHKRDDDALKILDGALRAHPEDADCHLLAGRLRLGRKEYDAARKHFEAVRLQNPFNPEIHVALRALYQAKGETALATQEERFFELSKKPRPKRTYELPAPRAGTAKLNLARVPFGKVQLDGETLAAPLWQVAVAPGEHTLTYGKKERRVSVAAGKSLTVVLD